MAAGVLNGRQVRLEWRGGLMGARSRLTVDGEGRWRTLIEDEAALVAALDSAL